MAPKHTAKAGVAIAAGERSGSRMPVAASERDAHETLLSVFLHLRSYPRSPRETDGTKYRILTSAVELFASRGLQATSMRDIAAAVGIKAASIYAHFPSKEALLGEAMKWVQDDIVYFVTEALDPAQSEIEQLKTIITRHAMYQIKNPDILDAWHVIVDVDRVEKFLPDEVRDGLAAQRQLYHDLQETLVVKLFPELDNIGDRLRAIRVLCGRVGLWNSTVDAENPSAAAEFVWSIALSLLEGQASEG